MGQTKTQVKGVMMLFLTAIIWGTAFVAQSVGMDSIGAFTFSGIRVLMGAVALLPLIYIRDKMSMRSMDPEQLVNKRKQDKNSIKYGMILGVVFFAASNFQQFSLYDALPGKVAFITALYIFFVPFLELFLGKRASLVTWISVFFGFVGLYFLCIDPRDIMAIGRGEILAFICSIGFAIHIIMIERFTPYVDSVRLSFWQFVTGGLISCVCMFIFEEPHLDSIVEAIIPLLYTGVMSCGVAYTLQIMGQRYTDSTIASLILCMESVFGVLASMLILHETLTVREILGCCIMFLAIVISQVSNRIRSMMKR